MKYLRALIATYSLFVVLWFAAYLIVPDQWWLLILLNKLVYFFLVAAIPVFIVALLNWKKSTVGLALLPVLVFAYFYAPFLILNNAIEKLIKCRQVPNMSTISIISITSGTLAQYGLWVCTDQSMPAAQITLPSLPTYSFINTGLPSNWI